MGSVVTRMRTIRKWGLGLTLAGGLMLSATAKACHNEPPENSVHKYLGGVAVGLASLSGGLGLLDYERQRRKAEHTGQYRR